jgi:hypothetical protein
MKVRGGSTQSRCYAEVGDKGLPGMIDQDVGEFEIAVNHAVAVGMIGALAICSKPVDLFSVGRCLPRRVLGNPAGM